MGGSDGLSDVFFGRLRKSQKDRERGQRSRRLFRIAHDSSLGTLRLQHEGLTGTHREWKRQRLLRKKERQAARLAASRNRNAA